MSDGSYNGGKVCRWMHDQTPETIPPASSDSRQAYISFHSGYLAHRQQQPVLQVDGSFSYDREILAAEFCFAISDDHMASFLFKSVYSNLAEQHSLSPHFAVKLAINCARGIQTKAHAEEARLMLQESLRYLPQPNDRANCFLFRALHARTFESTTGKSRDDTMIKLVSDIVEDIVRQGQLVPLQQRGLKLDVVTYQSLYYALVRYNENLGSRAGHFDVKGILHQFIQQLEHSNKRHASTPFWPTCLRACLQWCAEKLVEEPSAQKILKDIPCDLDETVDGYREDLEAFTNLWFKWLTGKSTGDESSSTWDRTAEAELGISATELLATITWIITGECIDGVATDATIHAYQAAERLASMDDSSLLNLFLNRFLCTNNLVQTTPQERDFRNMALPRLRDFAAETLQVRMPALYAEPVPAGFLLKNFSPQMEACYRLNRVMEPPSLGHDMVPRRFCHEQIRSRSSMETHVGSDICSGSGTADDEESIDGSSVAYGDGGWMGPLNSGAYRERKDIGPKGLVAAVTVQCA